MKQSTNVNVEERFGQLIAEVSGLLEEHERRCLERVKAAKEAAQGDITRFKEAADSLPRERRRLADLEGERERLPLEAFRANMEGDGERESELRKRHREIKPEDLEALRRSCSDLEAEKNALGGTSHGAEKQAHETARDTHASVLADLERFEGQIARLTEAVGGTRAKLMDGQRRVEEHLQFLRQLERDERREARREGARSEEEARRLASVSFPGRKR